MFKIPINIQEKILSTLLRGYKLLTNQPLLEVERAKGYLIPKPKDLSEYPSKKVQFKEGEYWKFYLMDNRTFFIESPFSEYGYLIQV